MLRSASDKKKELVESTLSKGYDVGETINAKPNDARESDLYIITKVNNDSVLAYRKFDKSKKNIEIKNSDITGKNIFSIGPNPFDDDYDNIRPVTFTLSSILFNLNLTNEKCDLRGKYDVDGVNIGELSWNPVIIDRNNEIKYYQRDFVWTESDKRSLIDSIYNGIDCGKVLIRKRSFVEINKLVKLGITDVSFNDVVDGKQRLNALMEFVNDKFCDSYGNYFSDLSNEAQSKFSNTQCLSFSEMGEDTPDNVVIKQFLKMNFTGIPQSKEHIDFVKSLNI